MKKLIILMASTVITSPIVNNASSIDVISKINNLQNSLKDKTTKQMSNNSSKAIEKNINSSALKSDDYAQGIFLYNPNVNVNSTDNQPFGSENTLSIKAANNDKYMDDVFLKSLQWNSTKKLVVSSLSNLKTRDTNSKVSSDTISEDINDYNSMETLVSQTNPSDSALQEGMSVLNRLINAGAVNFNNIGYVPDRETAESLMNDSSSGALSDSSEQQTVITFNKNSSNIDFSKVLGLNNDNEKISMNIHWYGVSIYIPPKYLTNSVISYLNTRNNLVNSFTNTIYNALSQEGSKNRLSSSSEVEQKDALHNDTNSWFLTFISSIGFKVLHSVWKNYAVDSIDKWEGPNSNPTDGQIEVLREELLDNYDSTIDGSTSSDANIADTDSFSDEVVTGVDATTDSDLIGTITTELEEAGEVAAAATTESVIGPFIIMALLVIIVLAMPFILLKIFTAAFNGSTSKTNLANLSYDTNSATPRTINASYVNFVGEYTTTWTQKTTGSILPETPEVVPPAIVVPPSPSQDLKGVYNLVTGSTNNFTTIMDPSIWNEFIEIALDDGANGISVSDLLKKAGINDDNLYLSNTDWYNIIKQLKYTTLDPHCAAVLEVVNKEVTYTNIVDSTGKTNLEYNNTAYLTSSFIGKDSNDMSIILTKDQLSQLSNNLNLDETMWTDIQKSPLNNPNNYTSFEEWFYENYIKDKFWIDSDLSETTIENFVDKLITKYQSAGTSFTTSQLINMTNDNNNVYDITSSMLSN